MLRDRLGAVTTQPECDRRRARSSGRRTKERDVIDGRQAIPELSEQRFSALVDRPKRAYQSLATRTTLAADRRDVLHGGCRADDAFVILRSRLEPLRRLLGRGLELRNIECVHKLASAIENAGVRSIELVRRADEKITADGSYVDEIVWREVHGIDERQGSRVAGHRTHRRDVR